MPHKKNIARAVVLSLAMAFVLQAQQEQGTLNFQTTVALGSATVRNAQSKLRESPSVMDFGAVGNGIANDAPAFQSAVNAIASGTSGSIACPAGTYLLNTTITASGNTPFFVLAAGCVLTGSGTLGTIGYIRLGPSQILTDLPIGLGSYTVSGEPSASPAGQQIWISNGNPGTAPCTSGGSGAVASSDGTQWNCSAAPILPTGVIIGNGTTTPAAGIPGLQNQYFGTEPNVLPLTYAFLPKQTVYTSDYNFPAQTCNSSLVCSVGGSSGGALAVGSNSITMQPVPLGVNGSDTNHTVWVSGGTQPAEACSITGGPGTSGQSSGVIQITCGTVHTGSWTVQSSTSGGEEAKEILASARTGGTIQYVAGTLPLHATLVIDANAITVAGSGIVGTVLLEDPGLMIGVQFGTTSTAVAYDNLQYLTVSRQGFPATVPSGSVGVLWRWFSDGSQTGIFIGFSDIDEVFDYKDTSSLSVSFDSYNANLSNAGTALLKVAYAAGIHWFGGLMGVNGELPPYPPQDVIVTGAANDLKFSETNFIPCPGGPCATTTAVAFIGAISAFVFQFDMAHFESFNTGSALFTSDSATSGISQIGFSNCTFSDISVPLFAFNSATAVYGLSISGSPFVGPPITLNNPLESEISGNLLYGAGSYTGGGHSSLTFTGNTEFSAVSFAGGWSALSVSGNAWFNGTCPSFTATGGVSYGLNTLSGGCSSMQYASQFQGAIAPGQTNFAGLGAALGAGFEIYCTDCTTAATCAGSGTGHMAVSNGTNWTCQ